MGRNFIWLFGENLAATSNNNSYYFWKQVVRRRDGIDKYIVLEKNAANKETYASLSDKEKSFVVWKNTVKHFKIYLNADMYFVSLSYKDITPTKLGFFKTDFFIEKPLIYLQHGTLGIKAIEYKGYGYNNNMFRFLYYNKNIKPTLMDYNKFKDYQLYYGIYPPRYIELVKRHKAYHAQPHNGKNILWFMTWREYLGDNYMTQMLMHQIKGVLSSQKLADYLDKTNSVFTVCLHQFFDEEKIEEFKECAKTDRIKFIHSHKTDVLDELAKNDVLITDYSSVGFDFTVLNKPVILYQPDLKNYLAKRNLYCEVEELEQCSYTKARQLVDAIADETYTINPFFKSRLPEEIDYDFIESGAHIDRMYEEFSSIQKNKVTFLGYNFYGVGGTVFATRSLAEALLEKNYLVELLSLKCTAKPKEMPYGLQLTALYKANSRRKIELLKRGFFRWKGLYGHLDCDCSRQNLSPYAGMAMRKKLENINSKTVISTRESLHLFLNDATSEKIEEKIYFFHCTAALVNELFPDIVNKMEKIDIGKAVFVSEENRQLYLDKFNFKNYKDYIVLGNTLESSRSVAREDIGAEEEDDNKKKVDVPERDYFLGMYLLRISHEREADINNLIGFAKYLKEQNVDDIVIDVYGTGDYLNEFLDKIFDNEVEDYICYCGETSNPKNQMKNHDAVVDFTLNHSFGMPYIEAILNGKMVYCTENTGSREVLNGIDGCIYTSYEDLLNKIRKFPEVTDDQLRDNYDKISKVYSREVLGEKFVEFLKK